MISSYFPLVELKFDVCERVELRDLLVHFLEHYSVREYTIGNIYTTERGGFSEGFWSL